ncbi:MAG: ABC transporter permease [Gemmatimonadaceae bacterium]
MMRSATNWLTSALLFLAAAVGVLSLLLLVTGHPPAPALAALVRGSVGSGYALSTTVVRAIPLALSGLAVALAFRAGLLNIGAEGQLLMGACAATAMGGVIATLMGGSTGSDLAGGSRVVALLLILIASALAGAAWAGIAAVLRRRFGVLEVISTIMLNFIALSITGWLVRGPLQEPARINPQSASLPQGLQLPVLLPGTRIHAGVLLAVGLALALWWWLRDRASGFRLRAVGGNPFAAASAGQIAVARTTLMAFLLSGALAGVAGGVELTGVTFALYENFSPGYGYTAIAVALLARLSPVGVLGTALLFGALEAGASAMQRDAMVPSVVVSVVEASLILLVVAADRWRSRGAAEAGV